MSMNGQGVKISDYILKKQDMKWKYWLLISHEWLINMFKVLEKNIWKYYLVYKTG